MAKIWEISGTPLVPPQDLDVPNLIWHFGEECHHLAFQVHLKLYCVGASKKETFPLFFRFTSIMYFLH